MPKDKDARLFYRVAQQRLTEAQDVSRLGYTTLAVYLGGYVVETILKALLIEFSPRARRADIVDDFRGGRGHHLEYLRNAYYNTGGATMPAEIVPRFANVNIWTTSLRYQPGNVAGGIARTFLGDARAIFQWADGRF